MRQQFKAYKINIQGVKIWYRYNNRTGENIVDSDSWARVLGYRDSRELMIDDSSRMKLFFNNKKQIYNELRKS